MASYHAVRTARLTDRQVLDLIYALKTNLEAASGMITLGEGMTVDIVSNKRTGKPVSVLDRDRHAIRSAELYASPNLRIEFFRGICVDTQNPYSRREASP